MHEGRGAYTKSSFFPLLLVFCGTTIVATAIFFGVSAYFFGAQVADTNAWILPLISGVVVGMFAMLLRRQAIHLRRIRYEFLTTAAHQLRTPLTRIQWTLSNLAQEVHTGNGRELINMTKKMLGGLVDTINSLLDASEASGGNLYFDYLFENGNLGAVVRRSMEEYNAGIKQKNLTLTTDIRHGLPPVKLDRERMQMAISILLENAIIYTSVGGAIQIKTYQDGNKVVFSIKDSGIGISQSALPHIFTQFFRSREAISMDPNRSGLGLSIAKEIVEKHGGTIQVQSKGKDQGSYFWFSLPIVKQK